MGTTLTSKGKVTIPKHIRDALSLVAGSTVEFSINRAGELVLQPPAATPRKARPVDRFQAVRGSADVHWRTADLMKLLRADD
ncbi:MAG: AbrB/MazE/SpoVT family DNA-binding domain-containing protein [Rubrivivax sp.]